MLGESLSAGLNPCRKCEASPELALGETKLESRPHVQPEAQPQRVTGIAVICPCLEHDPQPHKRGRRFHQGFRLRVVGAAALGHTGDNVRLQEEPYS